MEFKECNRHEKCIHLEGPILPLTKKYFFANCRKPDGHSDQCKACAKVEHAGWYENNKITVDINTSLWRLSNPDRARGHSRIAKHKRRMRVSASPNNHTYEDIVVQFNSQEGKCFYCAIVLGKDYQVDHIIPLSRGGSNGPENIACTCPSCNMSKGSKLIEEWLA